MTDFMERKRAEFAELIRKNGNLTDAYGMDMQERGEPAVAKIATLLSDVTQIPGAEALEIVEWLITRIEHEKQELRDLTEVTLGEGDFAARVAHARDEEPA